MEWPMYARLKIVKHATVLEKEAKKNRDILQDCYIMDYDRRVGFSVIFFVSDNFLVDGAFIIHLAAEGPVSKVCKNL